MKFSPNSVASSLTYSRGCRRRMRPTAASAKRTRRPTCTRGTYHRPTLRPSSGSVTRSADCRTSTRNFLRRRKWSHRSTGLTLRRCSTKAAGLCSTAAWEPGKIICSRPCYSEFATYRREKLGQTLSLGSASGSMASNCSQRFATPLVKTKASAG